MIFQAAHLVFCTSIGTPLDAANVRRTFKRITKAAALGEDWTPRELRTSFVSLMSDSGVPVEEIARLVGHTSSRTTEVVYRNSRELHQPGEKPQVTRSQWCRDSVLDLRTAAV